LSGVQPITLEVGETFAALNERTTLPKDWVRLMTEAVQSFTEELGHSPVEVRVLTGAPLSRTLELLSRIQAM
jgi:hypothetical protein